MTRLPVAVVVLFAAPVAAQQTAADPPRRVVAARVDGAAPRVDGRLDDASWTAARPADDFVLREPTEGVPAPERTEVRFIYTEDALYIGARMYSGNPTAIRKLVARRDREVPSEQLVISLDSRADRRTAYTFGVTPGGVRSDYFHASDFEDAQDESFDPVWEARTAVDSLGWTAELRIPFTQLRYNPGREQVWGVNLVRRVPARNEEAFWVLVRRNETGWSSRMGRLEGIADIPPARRLELAPYIAGNGTRVGAVDADNPFAQRYDGTMRVGGDLKMGLGPNLTLDATFNPDFGQVEADPAEVNLTAFETFFSERRPFFVEGADLFGGRGTFYSRRIGAPPALGGGGDYAESRDNTTILGAAKVTGRLPSGLALGALSAVTAREWVQTYDSATSTYGTALVAPFTAYGIVTARQELGHNRSTLAATFTAVERDIESGSVLASVLARRAYTGVVDGRLRWAGGNYDMSAYLGVSHVSGDSSAILRQQLSPRRYYQRPDADHVEVDSGRTSLTGITAGINHSKLAGNWRWDIDYILETPGLELNDLGALGSADDMGLYSDIYHRRTRPGPVFHNWTLGLAESAEWNVGGTPTFSAFGLFGEATLKNFWQAEVDFNYISQALNDNLTRGGPLMRTPRAWQLGLELGSRRGARTSWRVETFNRWDELDGSNAEAEGSLVFRPGTQWEISIDPSYSRVVTARQYVVTRSGGGSATYGRRYIFARLVRSEIVTQLRFSYAIRPDLTVEAYVEPFASSGRYAGFGELVTPRTFDLRVYDPLAIARNGDSITVTDGASAFSFDEPDFDVRSLRSNLVLRWEWRPGSTLFLVWQQDRYREGLPSKDVGPRGLWEALSVPGDQFLALKVSYWIPVR
ncbi:MAG TPA: DUF5916 domain-containing protein [Gemmatimonadales bacterium]